VDNASSPLLLANRDVRDTAASLRGRDAEIVAARDVLLRAETGGEAGVITILGPPGIGKSAVLDALANDAALRGFRVGRSKADEGDQIAPMAPLLLALRSGQDPLISDAAFAELATFRDHPLWLIDRIIAVLEERSLESPLLVVLDDGQWADRLTLSCLRIMPARLGCSPVVWAVAARDGVAAIDALVEAYAHEFGRARSFRLEPLPAEAIEAIAGDRLGSAPSAAVRQLLREAAGNPFLAVSLLDGLGDLDLTKMNGELPRRLASGVRRRLAPLSASALELVRAGAVLGRPFALREAGALLSEATSAELLNAVDEAVNKRVLREAGALLAFTHDLVRQAVYEDIPSSTRFELHRLVVAGLVEGGVCPLEAVPHILATATFGDREAATLLAQAAQSVVHALPAVAVDVVLRALALLPETDPLWLEVGRNAFSILAAARHERDALALADRLGRAAKDPETFASIQATAAWPLWSMGRVEEMLSRLDTANSRGDLPQRQRADIVALRALGGSRFDEYDRALAAGESALEASRTAGNAIAEATAARALAETSMADGRFADALQHLREIGSPAEALKTIPHQILLLQLLDRYDESAELLARAQELVERGADIRPTDVAFAQMWQDYSVGNFDDAEADALTIVQESEEVHEETHQVEARMLLARIAQLRGRYDLADRHFALATADTAGDDETREVVIPFATVFIHESRGDYERARPLVRDVMHPRRGVRHRLRLYPGWLVVAARCAVRSGDHELAAEFDSLAEGLAKRNPEVTTILGVAEHVRGMVRQDIAALRRATLRLEGSPRPFLFADALADYGRALLEAGERDAAVTALDRAWDRFHVLQADGDADRVQHALPKTGVRHPRWTSRKPKPLTGWDSLTTTEQRVAQLIFQGHTNRSAARALALSSHTVATHLRAIFGKMEVNSRVQLVRAMMDHRASQ